MLTQVPSVNFAINIILLVSKGFAVLSSTSISLVASFIDSALDFLSTLIILGTSIAMGRQSDRHKYPAGKKRFEPLGVLIFAVAMIASFAQVRWVNGVVAVRLIGVRAGLYRVLSESDWQAGAGGCRTFLDRDGVRNIAFKQELSRLIGSTSQDHGSDYRHQGGRLGLVCAYPIYCGESPRSGRRERW
jgi:hypothetical protein